MSMKTLLIVDDEVEICSFFRNMFAPSNLNVIVANTAERVKQLMSLEGLRIDLALVDLKLPDSDGLALLKYIKTCQPLCEVIIMTGYSTVKTAVEAIQNGAKDYIEKPFTDIGSLENMILNVLDGNQYTTASLLNEAAKYGIIYAPGSPMEHTLLMARRLSAKDINVVLDGETGTGKELLARFIHGTSPRSEYSFVAVNCGAIPEALLESELFGHERGAFTGAVKSRKGYFELANNGTLFLDEVGEAPLSVQVKLLRAVESEEYQRIGSENVVKKNVRIISATHRNLELEVKNQHFRADLLYRLEGVKISLPPLRERPQDISFIAHNYINKKFGEGYDICAEALYLLQRYDWPGNVRQLLNVLNQAISLHECRVIQPKHLPESLRVASTAYPTGSTAEAAVVANLDYELNRLVEQLLSKVTSIEEIDFSELKRRIKQAEADITRGIVEIGLRETGGNRTLVCEKLGINQRMLRYLLNERRAGREG